MLIKKCIQSTVLAILFLRPLVSVADNNCNSIFYNQSDAPWYIRLNILGGQINIDGLPCLNDIKYKIEPHSSIMMNYGYCEGDSCYGSIELVDDKKLTTTFDYHSSKQNNCPTITHGQFPDSVSLNKPNDGDILFVKDNWG